MFCSIPGCVYDVLRFLHPAMPAAHAGTVGFSTLDNDNEFFFTSCALMLGGGWWYTQCSLFGPTLLNPSWYSPPDNTFYNMESARMLMKLQ